MMFGSDGGAGPAEHPEGQGQRRPSTTEARTFLRRAQTHTMFRSHRQHAELECRQPVVLMLMLEVVGSQGQIGR
jgi:hypothetical protein